MGRVSCTEIIHALARTLGIVIGSINFWIDYMGTIQHWQTISRHDLRDYLSTQQNLNGYLEAVMNNRNWLAFFGFLYVAVWMIGLLIPTGTLSPSMSNAEIQQVLITHQFARWIQVYLIDGVAGIAILLFAVMAVSLFQSVEEKNIARVVLGAGVAAGAISLVQAGVQQTLVNSDLLASVETPFRTLLVLVNQIDTFKLMALALLSISISIFGIRTRLIPAWVNWLGILLTIALILGGISFAFANSMLTAVLYASLPMLLVWVGAVSAAGMRWVK